MKRLGWAYCVAVSAVLSGPAVAQGTSNSGATTPSEQAPQRSGFQIPVIAFDRDAIFAASTLGQNLDAKIEELRNDLVRENDAIYAALEAEEKELSILKQTLTPEEFAARAEAFDEKVTSIRAAQKSKSETVQTVYDEGLREFDASLNLVLTEIAQEVGAIAVFERKQIYLMSASIDISRGVVARMNARAALAENIVTDENVIDQGADVDNADTSPK